MILEYAADNSGSKGAGSCVATNSCQNRYTQAVHRVVVVNNSIDEVIHCQFHYHNYHETDDIDQHLSRKQND